MIALLDALDASQLALRRAVCRGWADDLAIHGRLGHIYADGTGYLLCVAPGGSTTRRWTNVKRRLGFCRLMQDGDDEGCLRLDRLPTPVEAEAIRDVLGIQRKRHYQSPETEALVMATLAKFSIARLGNPASGGQALAESVGR
jgi:hypothetical protein